MTIKEASLFCKDGDWIESKDQSLSGIRLIQTGNIGVGVYLDKFSRAKYISEETFNKLECTEVFPGDIIISRLPTPVGRACIVPDGLGRTIAAVDCTILRINEKKFLKEYVLLYTETGQYKSQIEKFLAGSTRVRISRKNLESISIPQKNLETQKNIVSIIYKIKNIVELRKQQLSKLDQLVKSRFIEMFGDPVENPYKWNMIYLNMLGELNRGISKHRPRNAPELLNGKYPLIQTGDIASSDLYITKYSSTYSELGLKQSRIWPSGTLCITIAANIAKTSILKFDACFPDSVVGFISGKEYMQVFIYFWFSFFQKILEEQAPESAQKNINLKILNELKVISPPSSLQKDFFKFVQQVEKTKSSVKQSLEKLETLKKTLMQEYFG